MAKVRRKAASRACIWEWRVFWRSRHDVPISFEDFFDGRDRGIERTIVEDTYLLLSGRRDNIKIRKSSLQYKQRIENFEGIEVYRPKVTLKFPIECSELADLFPRISMKGHRADGPTDLHALMEKFSYDPRWLTVTKDRRRTVIDDVELEFVSFKCASKDFWSICVQHTSFEKVAGYARRFPMENALVLGYTDFLSLLPGTV
jgi:hypothetical protein